MGLLANGFRYNLTGRLFGGTTLSGMNPSMLRWATAPCVQRNMLVSDGITDDQVGIPCGNLHPASWVMPQKSGAMSIRSVSSGELSADLIPSKSMAIDLTGMGDLEATGALVVSMLVALSGSGSLSASINGYMNMTCDLGGDGSLSASMNGIASLAIDLLGQGDLEATVAAFGNMEIDVVVTGTGLSTANVGSSVWQYLINGTEAQDLLATAGSGGVDYDTLWASMPTALKESLAAYVLAAATADPIAANIKEVNGVTVTGVGAEDGVNHWRPA